MKFLYQYRTSENKVCNGEISAANREAAYSELKKRGIRPAKMTEAPGVLNYLMGKGKRWIVIGVLSAVVLIQVVYHNGLQPESGMVAPGRLAESYADADGNARPLMRKQIWGDDAIIREGVRTEWKEVFSDPIDRFLSRFAQPGVVIDKIFVSPEMESAFKEMKDFRVAVTDYDLEEYKQLKCIVAGMRREFLEYVASGGNVRGYVQRLLDRQREEVLLFEKEKQELAKVAVGDATKVDEKWRQTNQRLRAIGLPSLPYPVSAKKGVEGAKK